MANDKSCQLPVHLCLYGIRFTLAVAFLPTGVAAIAGTCTFGCEFFTAALADQILTTHLAVFPLPPIIGLIATPIAVAIFFGAACGVEHPTAATADKFADSVSGGSKTRSLIRCFQIILMVLLPSFICHIHGDTLLSLALRKINVVNLTTLISGNG